jgi:hypothetical protein
MNSLFVRRYSDQQEHAPWGFERVFVHRFVVPAVEARLREVCDLVLNYKDDVAFVPESPFVTIDVLDYPTMRPRRPTGTPKAGCGMSQQELVFHITVRATSEGSGECTGSGGGRRRLSLRDLPDEGTTVSTQANGLLGVYENETCNVDVDPRSHQRGRRQLLGRLQPAPALRDRIATREHHRTSSAVVGGPALARCTTAAGTASLGVLPRMSPLTVPRRVTHWRSGPERPSARGVREPLEDVAARKVPSGRQRRPSGRSILRRSCFQMRRHVS